jgi:signal transduction histidine kinase
MARSSLLKKLKELEGNVLSLSHEFRRICQGLRSPTLDTLGLDSAIRSYTEEFKSKPEGRGLEVKLDLMKDGKRVPEDIAINLFRIYQEALANVAKHAHAKEVEVKFKLSSEEVELSIKDDGRGFVVPRRLHQFVKDGRLGLMGIHERARMVGGKLEVISRPEEGTEIRVRVPLNANLNFPRKLDKLSK